MSRKPSEPASQRFDVFLSYNRRDAAIVERIAQQLKLAGLEPWLDRWSLTSGGDWQRELGEGLDASGACAVFVGEHDLGAWELQEAALAIDRAATQAGFRVFAVLLPGVDAPFDPNRLPHFLRTRTWVDFRAGRDDPRALRELVNAVTGVPFGPDIPLPRDEGVAPYRGLRVFGEQDAPFFFGRDREVQRLVEKLKRSRFVAVLGPSGSGKSSLVRAGLVPSLRAGAMPEVDDWQVLVLRPGAAPLTALAAQLATLGSGQAMQATLDALARDPRTLHLAVELALAERPPGERVLVVVDQLEEVFTLCRDDAERRQLFATLLDAASAVGGRSVVIVTLRADFYARLASYPDLAQVVAAQQMLVGPMDADGLRQAIEEPARRVGLELESGLSETILADVGGEPGALPLLEHALLELWERRRGNMLTLEAYRRAGGVDGALAQRADEIFAELTADQQVIARRALLRLTQPGEGTEDTRRRASRDELAPAGGGDDFELVLGRLVDARMLTTARDEGGLEVVDVSHEALIRGWPRLRGWIDADRASLQVHRRLTDAAREWETLGREPAALYRGARLATAQEWLREHGGDVSALEREFLDASGATARRRTRRLRAGVGGLAALTAIVAALAIWALGQRDIARKLASDVTSLALASAATPLVEDRPDIALLLAFAGYRERPGADARSSILAALPAARGSGNVVGILRGHDAQVYAVAFSQDGRTLASASEDATVRLWDARTHKQLGAPLRSHGAPVLSVAFSPDGRMLATAGNDETIRLWDVRTHRQLGAALGGHHSISVAFSPDGRTLASGGVDGKVRLWDVLTRKPVGTPLSGHADFVVSVAFSPDGRVLASASADSTIRLWNVGSHQQLGQALRGHKELVSSVVFSADGRTLASAGGDGTVRVWDVRRQKQLGRPLGRHRAEGITAVAFTRDGRRVTASSLVGTIWEWDARTRKPLRTQRGRPLGVMSQDIVRAAFSSDATLLAAPSGDGTVRLLDTRGRGRFGTLRGHGRPVASVAFSPDGRTIASTGDDDTTRVWDTRTLRQVGRPLPGGMGFQGVAFSPDGLTLVSAGATGLRLWDMRTRHRLDAPEPAQAMTAAFSPDGRTLVTASGQDPTFDLVDTRTLRRLGKPLTVHADIVTDVAFSPDGHSLASAANDQTVRLWDARTRKPIGTPLRHANFARSVAFSPDGRTLASAGDDQTVRLSDARTAKQLGNPLRGHTSAVVSVTFSPDGRTLASTGDDRTIRLWDPRTHKLLLDEPLRAGKASFSSVAFSPDGRSLASAGDDGLVRIWKNLLWRTDAQLQAEICSLVGSSLSRTEWDLYAAGARYQRSCP